LTEHGGYINILTLTKEELFLPLDFPGGSEYNLTTYKSALWKQSGWGRWL